ncbi:MAG: hypothetical protein IT360_15100, partial [Gemmatimonadaceae bacterium]|nr:hypothetical protein [Gemmatimonadaceae bacterium]
MSIRASFAFLMLALAATPPRPPLSHFRVVTGGYPTPAATPSRPSSDSPPLETVPRNAARRVIPTKLRMVWQVGGDADDTTIMMPLQVRATREHFVVYDAIALRLLGLSPTTGRVAWRFGRPGRGPGEFGGVAKVTSRRGGGTFVVDFALSRITEVTEDGKEGPRVDYRMGVNPRGVCEAGDSHIRLRSTESGEIERVQLATGATSTEDLPWPELRTMASLVRQSMIFEHPQAGVCMISVSFGPMFALLDQSGVRARARWIEEIPMGQAKSLGKGSWEMLPSVKSAQGVTGIGDSFAVLFRGRGPKRGRFVDFYSVTDAAYLFSIELP